MRWCSVVVLFGGLALGATSSADSPADWPRWRGAGFDGKATTGSRPFAKPFELRVRWKRTLGAGYSGVVVSGGHAVTMFSDGTRDFVVSLSADTGTEEWRVPQDADLLERLDVVVASVHSKLRMPEQEMTRRMVLAVASPHVDILGHCTGRKVVGTGRPQSQFDADIVFAACARFDTAVEINCRPERQDPPEELLALALDWECKVSIDTDAHAPGQLEWQAYGCDKAARLEIEPARIVNTLPADDLLAWTASHTTS